jgi:hypothetical protein
MTTEAAKTADKVFEAMAGFVRAEIEKRFATLDVRLRALETGGTLQSHEHRLDRHADHLAALETRLKKLERE